MQLIPWSGPLFSLLFLRCWPGVNCIVDRRSQHKAQWHPFGDFCYYAGFCTVTCLFCFHQLIVFLYFLLINNLVPKPLILNAKVRPGLKLYLSFTLLWLCHYLVKKNYFCPKMTESTTGLNLVYLLVQSKLLI
jgi:hypothetical protein